MRWESGNRPRLQMPQLTMLCSAAAPPPPSRFTCDFWGRGQRMRVAGAKHCGQCMPAVKCHLLWSVQGLAALIKAGAWILNPVLTSNFRSRLS